MLKRFTSAVLAGDVAKVRKIMKTRDPSFFFRGAFGGSCRDCRFGQRHFSCLDVLSSPFCLAIARNQIEVFF